MVTAKNAQACNTIHCPKVRGLYPPPVKVREAGAP